MPTRGAARPRRLRPGALRLVHPFPSVLNALLVLGLALLAGASPAIAGVLALAMLALQFSIGASNDYFDADLDARSKPAKPIPAGLVARRTAVAVALACGALALLTAAALGPVVLLMAAVMLGAGLAYDAFLKGGPWAWTAYAVAFPILPLYAWYGASAEWPPRSELLLPLAALAGPALHLANGLVDVESDRAAGLRTLAAVLGRRVGLAAMAVVLAGIHGLAWLTLVLGGGTSSAGMALVGLATLLAAAGLRLSAAVSPPARERGWQAQALSICLLALGWLASAVGERAGPGAA
ncbi:MAG TPA: UbiA family prenyltransferase [Candidatus Limnocylindria bacterium]|nr:UbiA family prenyltransferase [Candidatus Limnocylindria bacterium]